MPVNFLKINIINSVYNLSCGTNSVDGIATRCRIEGPGLQPRLGDIFCAVHTGSIDYPQGVPAFLRVKLTQHGDDHPQSCSADEWVRVVPPPPLCAWQGMTCSDNVHNLSNCFFKKCFHTTCPSKLMSKKRSLQHSRPKSLITSHFKSAYYVLLSAHCCRFVD